MRIAFSKIFSNPFEFNIQKENISLNGKLTYKDEFSVLCKAILSGVCEHICDSCGKDITLKINENLELILYNGEYKSSEILEDVVEFYDGFIDLDEVLNSEIQSIKSDYFYCENCKTK